MSIILKYFFYKFRNAHNKCVGCETSDATQYCTDSVCTSEDHTEYLCIDCVKQHKRRRATRNHVISDL